VNVDSCRTLDIPNTVYRLTKGLSSGAGDCLVVAANKITIDMQGKTISGSGNFGITDDSQAPNDSIVIKNGSISGYAAGILLSSSRVSVLAVTATGNSVGIALSGALSLVKSSDASSNDTVGIVTDGDRAQVQQSTANNNGVAGIDVGSGAANCLVTMNTANGNGLNGISLFGDRACTVSYNTTNDNGQLGVFVKNAPSKTLLITHNTAVNNTDDDFRIVCPSTVTFNTSTHGFPTSYEIFGSGCQFVGNE
jgi:parallel beta-helix repeat protein